MILLILCALACLLDAVTTNSLVHRGGYEKVSAWIIGKYPEPWKVWGWVFTVPTVFVCWLWVMWPGAHEILGYAFLGAAVYRTREAWKNHRLRR